jgi:sialic acid synthase SpsE
MANKSFTLGDRKIGADAPCYLIVEVGTTCMGDIDKALALVEKAKEAGVDAIKFQVIDPQQVSDPNATYLIVHNGQEQRVNMKEMFDKLVFTEEQWKRIIDACARLDSTSLLPSITWKASTCSTAWVRNSTRSVRGTPPTSN